VSDELLEPLLILSESHEGRARTTSLEKPLMLPIPLAPLIRSCLWVSATVFSKGIGFPRAQIFEEALDRFLFGVVTARQQPLEAELGEHADLPLDQMAIQGEIRLHHALVN